jgi:hypothetical protein
VSYRHYTPSYSKSEEVKKILEEAQKVAEQRLKAKLNSS